MSRPRRADLLKAIIARLLAYAPLTDLIDDRAYNHTPQDQREFPYVLARISRHDEWDTKDSAGLDCDVVTTSFTNHDGDLEAHQVSDVVTDALHLANLTLDGGQQVLLSRYETGVTPEPADTLSHRDELIFHVICTD